MRRGSIDGPGTVPRDGPGASLRRSANGRRAGDRAPTGPVEGAGQLVADRLLGHARGGQHRVEVEPGADAGLLEHVDELLSGDVAAGTGGERAAAESADRRVQLDDAGLDGDQG